jgi:hypothetical protein
MKTPQLLAVLHKPLWRLLFLAVLYLSGIGTGRLSQFREAVVSPSTETNQAPTPVSTPPGAERPELSWANLEAETYSAFLQNLRRIGCPEDILRDLIVAELFCDEYGLRPDGAGPWDKVLGGLADAGKAAAIADAANQILDKPVLEVRRHEPGSARSLVPVAQMGPEPASPGELVEGAYEKERNKLWLAIGLRAPTQAERDALLDLESKRQVALERLYPAAELERYELGRSGRLAETLKEFSPLKLSDDEAVTLIRLRDYEFSDEGTASAAVQDARNEALLKLLGDDRYTAYLRLQDPTYRMLDDLGRNVGLSGESIAKAYAMVSTGNVLPDAKGPFEAELRTTLGEAGFTEWVKIGDTMRATLERATAAAPNGIVGGSYSAPP